MKHVGLALAQARHGQQGLLSGVQASPSGAQLGAVGAEQVGEHDQRAIGHWSSLRGRTTP